MDCKCTALVQLAVYRHISAAKLRDALDNRKTDAAALCQTGSVILIILFKNMLLRFGGHTNAGVAYAYLDFIWQGFSRNRNLTIFRVNLIALFKRFIQICSISSSLP